jgi:Bacterial SH3 domain
VKIPKNIPLMESDYFYPLIGVLASLLGAYIGFRYFLYYRGLIYNGTGNQDKNRRLIRRAQVFILISSLAFTGSLVNLFNLSGTAVPPSAIATLAPGEGAGLSMPGVGEPSPTPSTFSPLVSTPSPESSPTAEVVPSLGFARIGNTNGFGVNVRSEPGLEYEMLTQLSDGSLVELTGEAQSADGFTWQRVRLEDGHLGWIADNFLIPEP